MSKQDFFKEKIANLLKYIEERCQPLDKHEKCLKSLHSKLKLLEEPATLDIFISSHLLKYWRTEGEKKYFDRAAFSELQAIQRIEFIKEILKYTSPTKEEELQKAIDECTPPKEIQEKLFDYFEMFCDVYTQ